MSSFSCLINENITKVCSFLYVGVYLDKILACQKSCQKWWRTPSSAWFWKAKQKHFELQPDLFWLLQICNSCNWYKVSQHFSRANFCHQWWPTTLKLSNFMIAKPFISAFCNSRANFSSALHILLLETGKKVKNASHFIVKSH